MPGVALIAGDSTQGGVAQTVLIDFTRHLAQSEVIFEYRSDENSIA